MRRRGIGKVHGFLLINLLAAIGSPFAAFASAGAAEYYAAPHGKSFARATREDPWDLATALIQTNTIRPGDTLWLLGGVYRGHFISRLQGAPGKPVTVRMFPGQRATIDCLPADGQNPRFTVEGDWSNYWGFELTCSDTKRQTRITGSWPSDIGRGGILCRASHVKFINLVVHDTGDGIDFWSEGKDGEVYGCLIYHNGWLGPDRGHGHGIYTQNRQGEKHLVDNIVFNQFGYGILCYGSSAAFLNNFYIEGNIAFNNGCLTAPGNRTFNISIGGGNPVRGATVTHNMTYSDVDSSGIRLGFPGGPRNADASVADNYVAGRIFVRQFDDLVFTRNTLMRDGHILEIDFDAEQEIQKYGWDKNDYRQMGKQQSIITLAGNGLTLDQWRRRTGMDAQSTLSTGNPTGVRVFVRPNRYEPGRAHVAVFNWDRRAQVELDLSDVLVEGQAFRIVSAQDFYGASLVQGMYDGGPVRLSMEPTAAAQPVGMQHYTIPVTEPEFGAYVVLTLPEVAKN